jgi:hypothetical protein
VVSVFIAAERFGSWCLTSAFIVVSNSLTFVSRILISWDFFWQSESWVVLSSITFFAASFSILRTVLTVPLKMTIIHVNKSKMIQVFGCHEGTQLVMIQDEHHVGLSLVQMNQATVQRVEALVATATPGLHKTSLTISKMLEAAG